MNTKAGQFVIVLLFVFQSMAVFSQDISLEELEKRCEDARQEKIAPLRQQAIDECIETRQTGRSSQDPQEFCERFYSDFGEAGRTARGGFRQRMFHDIPECLEFYEAQEAQRPRQRQ